MLATLQPLGPALRRESVLVLWMVLLAFVLVLVLVLWIRLAVLFVMVLLLRRPDRHQQQRTI
jgi:hypothetical protein